MSSRVAKRAVKKILADLMDRGGLRQEWDQFDPYIRKEILRSWEEAVDETIREEGG